MTILIRMGFLRSRQQLVSLFVNTVKVLLRPAAEVIALHAAVQHLALIPDQLVLPAKSVMDVNVAEWVSSQFSDL
jgi:hypothetical protein